jgi:hypothetical protein
MPGPLSQYAGVGVGALTRAPYITITQRTQSQCALSPPAYFYIRNVIPCDEKLLS